MTKKHAHEQLNSFTGAFVKLRGIFKQLGAGDPYPNERKLHLFITAGSPESLQNAINIIQHCSVTGLVIPTAHTAQTAHGTQLQSQPSVPTYQYPSHQQVQLISQPFTVPSFSQLAAPQYQDQRHAPQSAQLLQAVSSGLLLNLQQKAFVYHARVSLGALAGPNVGHPGFSIKGKILGPQGQNVKHITTVTGAKVQLRGRGATQNSEADGIDDMYLDVNASSEVSLNQAVELATNLVETVRLEYIASVTKPLQHIVQSNSYNQPNAYGVAPQQYYPAPYPPMPLGGNVLHGHSVPAPRALPSPLFPPPPIPSMNPPPRPMMPMTGMQQPVPRTASTVPTPLVVQSKGCVPFMYPDGDAVVREPNPLPISTDAPPQLSLLKAPESSEGKGSNSTNVIAAPPPARLSLNGSTFEARVLTKADHSSSARSSSSSSSGSGSGNDRQHRGTSEDSRSNPSSSSSGSNKRRRGFQESSVYTAPVDCPLPTTLTHQTAPTPAPALNKQRREPLIAPSDSPQSTQNHDPPVSDPTVGRTLDLNGTHTPKGPEPASNVMAALAAMTERRMQAKMSRPLVPSFSSVLSPPERPPVPSFAGKPAVPLFPVSSAPSPSPLLDKNSDLQLPPAAASFKLPGLTAYEDDDDED